MKTVLHIITSLGSGGAEGVLYRLCAHSNNYKHIVINLTSKSFYNKKLEALNVNVYNIEMDKNFFKFIEIIKIIKREKPDTVQTWMYHADFLGGILAKLLGVNRVFWCVRNSNLKFGQSSFNTILVSKICSFLSYFIPNRIISCAHVAMDYHTSVGYKKNKFVVIPNGVEANTFYYDREMCRVKNEKKTPTIGMIARFDRQKDHGNLFQALKSISQRGYEFKVRLVGRGINNKNQELSKLILESGLVVDTDVFLVDETQSIRQQIDKIDIHVLSSAYGEGFPNTISETMACGVPNVVTNVGDSAHIVGDYGIVVPHSDSQSLATAIIEYIDIRKEKRDWEILQKKCEERIRLNFSTITMVDKFETVWAE
ncbi:glycosyltransferase [Salinivibrio costicola]|uniref:Glycosyltransferase n=1 Tax=Salinivibrio costicola TaxID=51367 RepID=A0ABX6K8M7_SALCS|nr:glycosyltransferase [Salinivibrio costicola]QIR06486.1 glycosyltransferase [Salinivibrio costicola]